MNHSNLYLKNSLCVVLVLLCAFSSSVCFIICSLSLGSRVAVNSSESGLKFDSGLTLTEFDETGDISADITGCVLKDVVELSEGLIKDVDPRLGKSISCSVPKGTGELYDDNAESGSGGMVGLELEWLIWDDPSIELEY